jgi:hypothetical protein
MKEIATAAGRLLLLPKKCMSKSQGNNCKSFLDHLSSIYKNLIPVSRLPLNIQHIHIIMLISIFMEIYFRIGEENLLCMNAVGVKRSTTNFFCV